jgi:4-amino-4-deoxy-L-arabinose transferase-like glycosyltransferase
MRRRTTITRWVLILAAVALCIVAQGYFVRRELQDGLIVYAIGAVLFVWAAGRQKPLTADGLSDGPPGEAAPRLGFRLAAVGLFLVALAAAVLGLRAFSQGVDLSLGWTFHLVSLASFMVGAYLLQGRPRRPSLRAYLTWREGVLLAAIIGLALFMRFFRFNSWPYGTWYDEADNALHVLQMMSDPTYRPVFVPSTNLPAHFLYLIFFSFKLFGASTLSVRVVTAALGVVTVVAGYLFGREFFDRRLALVLAFLLAVSRWDVNFSRIGLHGVSTPMFELLVLFFLLRGLRKGSRIDFAWAGLLTGLGLCFYAPFRLFPFVVILFLLHYALRTSGLRDFFLVQGVNLIVLGLSGLLVFAPVIQYARQHPDEFWSRTDKVSIFSSQPKDQTLQAIVDNTSDHLLMFNYQGDRNGRHNLPGAPELDYATAALFAIGAVYSLYRIRNPRYSLLVIWLLIMLSGGIFSLPFEAPQSLRAIGTLPVAYVLAVVPLAVLQRETLRTFPRRGTALLVVGLVALAGWVGWDNYNTYFNVQANDFASWSAYSTRETILAHELNKLDSGYLTYFTPILTNHLTTQFLAPQAVEQTPFDPAEHLPFRQTGEKGVAVFVDNESFAIVDLLRAYYPELELREFGPPESGPNVLELALISREQVEAIQGLPARYNRAQGPDAVPQYRQDATIDFDWQQDPPQPYPFDVEWRGVLVTPLYGPYGLRALGSLSSGTEVWLDGARLLGGEQPSERTILMARGRHDIRIRAHVAGVGQLQLQWQPPDSGWETIPQSALFGPPVTSNGLVGYFYSNANWEGAPAKIQIDPEISFYFHLIPLPRPYTVEWKGELDVPVDGLYGLGIECRDAAWLYVDDQLVLVSQTPDREQDTDVNLTAGRHNLRLRFLDQTDHSHIYLSWRPPGDLSSTVPQENLFVSPGGGWEPLN